MNETRFLSISQMLKATPLVEGDRRYVYIEASNEALDQQNETVLAKALAESSDYFLRYGNLDIDHITQIGVKAGIPEYELYEIGRPVDVRVDGAKTFVKGEVFTGAGKAAEKANNFWSTLTELNPPQRWYPSVGGQVLARESAVDPKGYHKKSLVTKVRWTNIGFSKTPVNSEVPTVSTVPFGVLAKCWGTAGLDLEKALEAGYGTNAADLTGGGALRKQSLYGVPLSYFDFREAMGSALSGGQIKNPSARTLAAFASDAWGLPHNKAAEWVERFMRDVSKHMHRSIKS